MAALQNSVQRYEAIPARLKDVAVLDGQVDHALHRYIQGSCSLQDALVSVIDELSSSKRTLLKELSSRV